MSEERATIAAIYANLELIYSEAGIEQAMTSPHVVLGGRTPRQLIDLGYAPEVLEWARQLTEGMK